MYFTLLVSQDYEKILELHQFSGVQALGSSGVFLKQFRFRPFATLSESSITALSWVWGTFSDLWHFEGPAVSAPVMDKWQTFHRWHLLKMASA